VSQFPQNQNVIEARSNSFGRIWHGFLERLHRRSKGAEEVAAIASPDIPAAGPTYSQAHVQTLVNGQNELKNKVNELLAALAK
jgi:hypothetical protein